MTDERQFIVDNINPNERVVLEEHNICEGQMSGFMGCFGSILFIAACYCMFFFCTQFLRDGLYIKAFILWVFVMAFFKIFSSVFSKQLCPIVSCRYVVTDVAIYNKLNNCDNTYQKISFEDVNKITVSNKREISIFKIDDNENKIVLKNIKDFDFVLNLLKEKTGIEPELVNM